MAVVGGPEVMERALGVDPQQLGGDLLAVFEHVDLDPPVVLGADADVEQRVLRDRALVVVTRAVALPLPDVERERRWGLRRGSGGGNHRRRVGTTNQTNEHERLHAPRTDRRRRLFHSAAIAISANDQRVLPCEAE